MAVASYLSVMFEHFAVCLERGVNVVTIEEEAIYPWGTASELATDLDRIAKAGGATLAASGAQDVFWMHLVGCLLGAAHRIDSVEGRCSWNADDYGPEVARHVHLGESRADFERHLAEDGWPDFVVRATLEALVVDAGFTAAGVRPAVTPVVASEPVWSRSLGRAVSPGEVLGVVDAVSIETAEGPTFSFEMAGRVYGEGESDVNHWLVAGRSTARAAQRPGADPHDHVHVRREPDPGRDRGRAGPRDARPPAAPAVPAGAVRYRRSVG